MAGQLSTPPPPAPPAAMGFVVESLVEVFLELAEYYCQI